MSRHTVAEKKKKNFSSLWSVSAFILHAGRIRLAYLVHGVTGGNEKRDFRPSFMVQ